jgi:hypothetical protein
MRIHTIDEEISGWHDPDMVHKSVNHFSNADEVPSS